MKILAFLLSLLLVAPAFAGGKHCEHKSGEHCGSPPPPPPEAPQKTKLKGGDNDRKWLLVGAGLLVGIGIAYNWGGSKEDNGWAVQVQPPQVEGGL